MMDSWFMECHANISAFAHTACTSKVKGCVIIVVFRKRRDTTAPETFTSEGTSAPALALRSPTMLAMR